MIIMKKIVVGILAHVDAGKTTLSEGLLYTSGKIRKLGRVDNQDAYLDTDKMEKERGITIFSKQAVLEYKDLQITLLDTPGHVDFSSEMERTLSVLDYAILVINGADGVQAHTKTLWRLLKRYEIPVFLFVNKMDQQGCEKESILTQLKQELSDCCIDFAVTDSEEFYEEAAMAEEHAIIKELKAVESLGCVSVICSDKTGTLTQNKMTVQQVYIDGKILEPEDLSMDMKLHRNLLFNAILTNDSTIVDGKGIGDPTEYCLIEMTRKLGLNEEDIRANMLRLAEIPFDSDRKLMSTKYVVDDDAIIMTKGALDVLLDKTTRIRTSEGVRPITDADKEAILATNMQFSENGLRVLAFAYKDTEVDNLLDVSDECDYTFTGLISMMDPPRVESAAAVADAKRAGIKPIMITGDYKITATAIAKQIGIFESGDLAVTGMELDAMTEKELDEKLPKISVYARVSPENKIQIVEAWQRRGNIVAMTGDGVNDAPALKKADIGVAMGITGTEVSKDAAAMILTDDNFATIIKAVANGRNVYRNIKNAIKFLLSGNMAGIFSVLYTSLMGLPVPFAPVHLLFMNLLTDSLPAIAIGMEPPEDGLLDKAPRDPKEGILTKEFIIKIGGMGGIIAICTMAAFYIGLNQGDEILASTMAFATLTLARLFHGFNCRSDINIFKLGFKGNMASLGAFVAGIVFLALVLFVPFLSRLFAVATLTGGQLGAIIILALIPTVIIQYGKIKNHNQ